jgi:hypothetical protein
MFPPPLLRQLVRAVEMKQESHCASHNFALTTLCSSHEESNRFEQEKNNIFVTFFRCRDKLGLSAPEIDGAKKNYFVSARE